MKAHVIAFVLALLVSFTPTYAATLHSEQQWAGEHVQDRGSTVVIYGSEERITLSQNKSLIVLDYAFNVEGFPTFQVVYADGDTSHLEVSYSETIATLEKSTKSDGPVGLAAAMDTYRINIYNITNETTYTNRLIQGGFRYQKFNLSSPGKLVLAKIGVVPTTSTPPIDLLSGSFKSSDDRLNRIWTTGARTIQLNEIPANSIPNFWQVSPEGSLVESQAPQVLYSAAAASLLQYTLAFDVKPMKNGFSFSVLANTLNDGIYINCDITNGSISANSGSTENNNFLAFSTLPTNITLHRWHNVRAVVSTAEIAIFIDDSPVLRFSQTYSFYGSFGLGAALGHSAVFRNLVATSPAGDEIYSSNLTDESFLPDFLMGTNPLDTTVDGSKRDRIAYTGDLDVAVGSTMASTYGVEYIQGTLDLLGSFQLTPGFFLPTAKIQQAPLSEPIDANITGLIGYSFNLLTAVAGFYQQTGNETLARDWAPKIVRMLDWADSQVLADSGLLNIANAAFGGDWNYYDPPQAGVVTKFNMVYAYALQSCLTLLDDAGVDTSIYSARLNALRVAINTHLWSDSLGAYYISEAVTDGFGQDSNAMAILAGVTNSNHTSAQVLRTLKQLSTSHGPLAFSEKARTTGFSSFISPYASAYHLRAALSVGNTDVAEDLLQTLWSPMADPLGTNYTGCFWETLNADGEPGLGSITSLCHAWGSGPTGEISTYVLGVHAVKPGFRQWKFDPLTMNLDWAFGTLPVPGGSIDVAWNSTNHIVSKLEIQAPVGTMGIIELPQPGDNSTSTWRVNGELIERRNHTFHVSNGKRYQFEWS